MLYHFDKPTRKLVAYPRPKRARATSPEQNCISITVFPASPVTVTNVPRGPSLFQIFPDLLSGYLGNSGGFRVKCAFEWKHQPSLPPLPLICVQRAPLFLSVIPQRQDNNASTNCHQTLSFLNISLGEKLDRFFFWNRQRRRRLSGRLGDV